MKLEKIRVAGLYVNYYCSARIGGIVRAIERNPGIFSNTLRVSILRKNKWSDSEFSGKNLLELKPTFLEL